MNNSPIGTIKQKLGIRNPYEQLVHLTKRRISDIGIHTAGTEEGAKFTQLFKGLDDETTEKAVKIMASAQGGTETVSQRLLDPAFQQLNEVKPEEVDRFRALFDKLKEVSDDWFAKEKAAAELVGLPFGAEPKIVYLPQKQGVGKTAGGQLGRAGPEGTGASGFTKHQKLTVDEKVRNNAAVFDYLMHDKLQAAFETSGKTNYQEFLEDWVRRNELVESAIDLQTAFTLRGMDHAKAMSRYEMVDEFRQFGVPIQDAIAAEPRLADSLNTWGGQGASKTGLFKVNVEGFKDYIFDSEVARVLTNAGPMMAGDASTKEFLGAFGWMTQWWKGFVLMTPGYHIRNFISNNVTGWLKFGPRWANEQKYFGACAAGTMYAMHPEKYSDLLTKQLGVKPGWVIKQLKQRWAGTDFTVQELADYMRQVGTVGARTQIAGEIGQQIGGKSRFLEKVSAKQFAPFKVSQTVGDFVENTAKFKNFLMNMEDMVGKGGDISTDLAERLARNKQFLEYADLDTKKWFIDYGDLTDWEKKTLAKVIPFYTWTRKNIANQLSGLALYPEMYSVIPKVRGAVTSDEDFDYSIMPDYMKNLGYYPIGQTAPGQNIMRWANIPLEDINKIPIMFEEGNIFRPRLDFTEIRDDIMSAAHPLIKSAVETMTGYDVFHKREIRPFEKAVPVLQYLGNADKVIKFLDGAMRLAGFDDGIKINVSRDGKEVQINGKVERFLETNLPALRSLDLILGGGETIIEQFDQTFEGWIEKTFGKKDYFKGLEELFQITSPMLGVKFKEFNQQAQEQLKANQLASEAQKLRAKEATPSFARETRAAKAKRTRETRNLRTYKAVR